MPIEVTFAGLRRAQRRLEVIMQKYTPASLGGVVAKEMLQEAYRHVLTWIHVDTGSLKVAQRMRMPYDAQGEVFTSPFVTNPRSGLRPAAYVADEFGRGGTHDTYAMVVTYRGEEVVYKGWLAYARHMKESGADG